MTDKTLADYIKEHTNHLDTGCWEWVGGYHRKQPRGIYKKQHIYINRYMWEQANPGEKSPHAFNYYCELGHRCINPDHKKPAQTTTKPATKSMRNYIRHDSTCGGIDPVVIDRIVSAGTIEALPIDHVICDCERAYILMHYQGAQEMLKINARRTAEIIHDIGATT